MSHRSLLGQITFPLIILFVIMAAGLFYIYCEITDTNSARVEQTLHKNLAQQIIHYSDDLNQGEISKTALKPAFHSLMLFSVANYDSNIHSLLLFKDKELKGSANITLMVWKWKEANPFGLAIWYVKPFDLITKAD